MAENNLCNHNFGSWKRNKKPILDCDTIGEEDFSFFKDCYQRKCKECGFIETKYQISDKLKSKKGKNKHLGLRME